MHVAEEVSSGWVCECAGVLERHSSLCSLKMCLEGSWLRQPSWKPQVSIFFCHLLYDTLMDANLKSRSICSGSLLLLSTAQVWLLLFLHFFSLLLIHRAGACGLSLLPEAIYVHSPDPCKLDYKAISCCLHLSSRQHRMPVGSCALAENASVDHHEELLHNMKGANPVS